MDTNEMNKQEQKLLAIRKSLWELHRALGGMLAREVFTPEDREEARCLLNKPLAEIYREGAR